jgi:hypothetical protein
MATKTCHEKGCCKLPTFNKERKTSGKFCGEHKKDGMVSIMYRHYNNQVDQIFKGLPQALQWEILVEFVGGFTVRYNRLRRLLSGELQEKIVAHNFDLNHRSLYSLWLKPFIRFPFSDHAYLWTLISNRWRVTSFRSDGSIWEICGLDMDNDYDPERIDIVAVAEFSNRSACVVLFEAKHSKKLSYGFKGDHGPGCGGRWYITDMNDSIVPPPYKKHVYPSYPYTNKKMGIPVLKMRLHNPIPEVPSSLDYNQIIAWKSGHRFR